MALGACLTMATSCVFTENLSRLPTAFFFSVIYLISFDMIVPTTSAPLTNTSAGFTSDDLITTAFIALPALALASIGGIGIVGAFGALGLSSVELGAIGAAGGSV